MKSTFLFDLIDKHNLGLVVNGVADFDAGSYQNFCTEYQELANKRDVNTVRYLRLNQNVFRTFLPYRYDTLNTAFQVQWYYDEIIIFDPISFHIGRHGASFEKRDELLQLIVCLNDFRLGIQEGIIVLLGYEAVGTLHVRGEADDEKYNLLIQIPEIRTELDNLVGVFRDAEENTTENYNIHAFFRNLRTIVPIVNKPSSAHMFFSIERTYTPVSREEIKQLGIYDRIFSGLVKSYPDELDEIYHYLAIGKDIHTPVLYDRPLDELVLKSEIPFGWNYQNCNTQLYNLTLPFVDKLTPEQVLELRLKMPQAFTDFRRMLFLINDKHSKMELDPNLLRLKVEDEIYPLLRKLDAEIISSMQRMKILGVGVPIVTMLGAFSLNCFGIKIPEILPLTVSLGSEAVVLANRFTERNTSKANPFYFLWKASNK